MINTRKLATTGGWALALAVTLVTSMALAAGGGRSDRDDDNKSRSNTKSTSQPPATTRTFSAPAGDRSTSPVRTFTPPAAERGPGTFKSNVNTGGDSGLRTRTFDAPRLNAPGNNPGVNPNITLPNNPPTITRQPQGNNSPLILGPKTGGSGAPNLTLPNNPPAITRQPLGNNSPLILGPKTGGSSDADAATQERLRNRSIDRSRTTGSGSGAPNVTLPNNPPAINKLPTAGKLPTGTAEPLILGPKTGVKGPDSDSADRLRNRLIDRSRTPTSGGVPGGVTLPNNPPATNKLPGISNKLPGSMPDGLQLGPKAGAKNLGGPTGDFRGANRMGMGNLGPDTVKGPRAEVRLDQLSKSGELSALTRTETGKQIELAKQFQMHKQGDVARRMALNGNLNHIEQLNKGLAHVHLQNAHNPHVANVTAIINIGGVPHAGYHGWISPAYQQACFHHSYFGPAYFTSSCWYPHWTPWVSWSWGYHCHMFWDPRPLWCRPIIYEPCPIWVYRPVPFVWVSLPEASCGTWVDVAKPVVENRLDLQLLAVRFVDPGHPEEKLGPRYRVWLRNNSNQPIVQPFNVVALAANGSQLVAGLPQAGVRVTSIDAGDMQTVDVRLPVDVFAMNRDAKGEAIPFTHLHVIVDANQEINDSFRQNNGVSLPRADVLPVDPATFEARPARAAFGGEVLLAGEGFGPGPGRVVLNLNGVEMDAQILGWYDLGVRLQLPQAAAPAEAQADITVIRADGAAANPARITVMP